MSENTYVQSEFDKAFIKAVEYLKKEKIIKLNKFAEQIFIYPGNLQNILSGNRGVPLHKITQATYVLTSLYDINPDYLKNGKGSILKSGLPFNKNEHPEYLAMEKNLEQARMKNKELEKQYELLKQINTTQTQLIESLKAQLENSAKK